MIINTTSTKAKAWRIG